MIPLTCPNCGTTHKVWPYFQSKVYCDCGYTAQKDSTGNFFWYQRESAKVNQQEKEAESARKMIMKGYDHKIKKLHDEYERGKRK